MKASRWSLGDWTMVGGVLTLGSILAYWEWHGRGPSIGTVAMQVAIAVVAYSVGRASS